MNLNQLKNITVVLLVFLSIYQTAKLWLEDFSGYNFFYYFSDSEKDMVQKDTNLHTVSRITVNLGNKKFASYDGDKKAVIEEVLSLGISSGRFAGRSPLVYNELLKNRSIILRFNYYLSLSPEENLLNKIKNSNTQNIGRFNNIIIIPESTLLKTTRILFVDDEDALVYEVTLKNDIVSDVQDIINYCSEKDLSLYYESNILNGFDLFKGNVFVEQWSGRSYNFPTAKGINPYTENGDLRLNLVEKHIDIFFDNPGGKWKAQVNQIYTYSDETTVVKYYPMGVLEYSKYEMNNKQSSVYNSYLAAINFLSKDTDINNEYYLSGYKIHDDRIVLRFDYKINGFPLIMSDELKKQTDMDSIIEITVSGEQVVKYKRYVYNYSADEETITATVNYLSAIDQIFASGGAINKNSVESMYLGYNIISGDACELKWFLKTNEEIFTVTVD